MIYYVTRFLARLAVWFNFRKTYIEHLGRVPEGKHVIYGLNHPTAFLDPVVLITHVPEKVWTMLRGDKFVNAPVRYLLHGIHNLPIYRASDGDREALRGNIATMAFATDRIVEGNGTVILSEGLCRHERRLRPIQRGTARLLFQAWKKDKSNDRAIAILPAGINYTAPNDFRSSVCLTYGEPIHAADYAEAYREDARATVEAVTEELHRRLRAIVLHVEDRKREPMVERLLPLIQHDRPDAGVRPTSGYCPYIRAQRHAVDTVNALDDFEAGRLKRDLDDYYAGLDRHGVTDNGLAFPSYGSGGRGLLLWLIGIPAMFGWLLNFPIAGIAQRRTEKMVRNPQFFASVRLGLGLALYVVYCLTWWAVLAVFVGWLAALAPIVFATSGYAYLQWRDAFELWRKATRVKSLSPEVHARLLADRQDLLRRVGALREEGFPVHPEGT